jgi:hypothetical protein
MKYVLIFSIFLIFSCKRENSQVIELLPELPSDSLLIITFKNIVSVKEIKRGLGNIHQDSIYIVKSLTNRLSLNQILELSNEKKKILFQKDSLYFSKQLNNKQDLSINKSLFFNDKVVLIDEKSISKKIVNAKDEIFGFGYYEFSKPFISANQDKAIIQIDYHCPNCGYGVAFIFEKKNKKWIIVNELSLWDN